LSKKSERKLVKLELKSQKLERIKVTEK